MKNILFFIAIVFLASCSQYTCPTNNGGKQVRDKTKNMTVYLKEGTISKDHDKTTLIKISRTQFGFKHLFISDQGDTIYKTYQQRLCVGQCYWLLKG